MTDRSVWIGYDPREAEAFAVARYTALKKLNVPIPVRGVIMSDLILNELYTRPTEMREGRLFDVISDHPMSTEFAISRFLVPYLVRNRTYRDRQDRWALFMDSDVLCRHSLDMLFAQADSRYAVMVVKHDYAPRESVKMDGQAQSRYNRKNWSSVMLFNVDHPSNHALNLDLVNSVPGRDLHSFCWLKDEEIGELPPKWNYLVGHHSHEDVPDPAIVHFTEGIPTMEGYGSCEYSEEWYAAIENWAR